MNLSPELAEGARNLLLLCATLEEGDPLLIVHEDPGLGWYDLEAPLAVASEARALGMSPSMLEVGAPGNEPDPAVVAAAADHPCVVFFSRMGDQDRFAEPVPGQVRVMCYVRDQQMLASPYGRTPHDAVAALKDAIGEVLRQAGTIHITCPLGTNLAGSPQATMSEGGEVSVRRFPMAVPQPVAAAAFSGEVVLSHYLTTTGSRVYEPAWLALEQPLTAEVSSGRIRAFTGDPDGVARVREHYRQVASRFDIDAEVVHSWHAGMHPGCAYTGLAAGDPDRWSNTVFGNPRFLHFHTCGDYSPGEICWMVQDPTIAVDGVPLWESGRLRPESFAPTRGCLDHRPELRNLIEHPTDQIGLTP